MVHDILFLDIRSDLTNIKLSINTSSLHLDVVGGFLPPASISSSD